MMIWKFSLSQGHPVDGPSQQAVCLTSLFHTFERGGWVEGYSVSCSLWTSPVDVIKTDSSVPQTAQYLRLANPVKTFKVN